MKHTVLSFVVAASLLSVPAAAQSVKLPAPSPAATVMQTVGVATATVEYSSPGAKGRTLWGKLVPYDKLWRTGANSATRLILSHDATIGGKVVPAGRYALYTIPGKKQWTMIVNKGADNGGTRGYKEADDVARVDVKPAKIGARERLSFVFSDTTDTSTRLDLEWGKLRVSLPVAFASKAQAIEGMDAYADKARSSLSRMARYYTEHAGDHDKAIALVDASLAIEVTWFALWIKATAQHKKGDVKAARANAQKAWDLGETNPDRFFYKDRVRKALDEWK
jgi:opacity protein-like surface antigen